MKELLIKKNNVANINYSVFHRQNFIKESLTYNLSENLKECEYDYKENEKS